ncbi:MAG: hypothetical protein L6R45_03075 [Anaerolineae bacterium]|nr:hypothetical protein [Anaerolineae bacterium]
MTNNNLHNNNLHKQRTVQREVRSLLQAARRLYNPVSEVSLNLSPWKPDDARAVRLASAWRTQAALSQAATAMRRVRMRAPEVRPDLTVKDKLQLDRNAITTLARFVNRYLDHDPEKLVSKVVKMTPMAALHTYGIRTWREVEDVLEHGAHDFEKVQVRFAQLTNGRGESYPDYQVATSGRGAPTYGICAEDQTGATVCTETDGDTFWTVLILYAIGGLIGWIGDNIEDWFNDTDDDTARAEIKKSSCNEIIGKPDPHWIDKFNAMIAGPTGDDDEIAILKVLNCLPCSRVKGVVNSIGVSDLMDEFHDVEWDLLVVRLQECGLVDLAKFDDDATRWFISQTPKAKLAQLSIKDIVALCWNLINGDCGDDDEAAIIRLIDCQHPCKIQKILKDYISFDDFDSGVDGEEWDELSLILWNALPSQCW